MVREIKEMAMDTALARKLDDDVEPPMQEGLTNEAQRKLCFELFNRYWEGTANRGVEFEVLGTMSVTAALFALVAKYGTDTTAEFLDDLAKSVRNDEFSFQPK
jgi:protoheme ferro-lyase